MLDARRPAAANKHAPPRIVPIRGSVCQEPLATHLHYTGPYFLPTQIVGRGWPILTLVSTYAQRLLTVYS